MWHMGDWIKGYKFSEAMIHSQRSKAVHNGNLTQQAVATPSFAPTLKVFDPIYHTENGFPILSLSH